MADEHKPTDPNPADPTVGAQPEDVEQMQYGKGPSEAELGAPDTFIGHPKGLWVLFITEMWERFSYYGMRALLVLYLYASTADVIAGEINDNPGFGWAEGDAYALYGVYTFMVYLTSIFGGLVADRFLGTHRSMLVGGWIIAAGHITLALTEFFHFDRGPAVSMANGQGALLTFLLGLAFIIIGTGFFKPCVSVMVGQLYSEGDARRDSGFTIFYMGINLGAFLSPLVAGTLGETVGWHWGFGSAAVGMIVGLLCYQFLRPRYLLGIGDPPEEPMTRRDRRLVAISLIGLIGVPMIPLMLLVVGWLDSVREAWGSFAAALGVWGMTGLLSGILAASVGTFLWLQPKEIRGRLGVIFVLAIFGNLGFWIAFEQAGTSMNVFASERTDRAFAWPGLLKDYMLNQSVLALIGGFVIGLVLLIPLVMRIKKAISTGFFTTLIASMLAVAGVALSVLASIKLYGLIAGHNPLETLANMSVFPATWYQSVNALSIIIFAPIFGWLWVWLDKRRKNPSTPMKFAIGLWLLGLSFLAMVAGALEAEEGLAAPHWLLITYIVYTWGELCLSPVGLSMVTKLATKKLQSLMMGLWFFSLALSNLGAGLVAKFSTNFLPDAETGEPATQMFIMPGLPGFFLMLVVGPIVVGVIIAAMSPKLRKMMGGIK